MTPNVAAALVGTMVGLTVIGLYSFAVRINDGSHIEAIKSSIIVILVLAWLLGLGLLISIAIGA